VCILLFFGVLSISRIAVHICVCSLCFVAPLYFQNCSVHMYVINVISSLLLMNVRSLMAKSTSNSFDCNRAACCKLSLSLSLCKCTMLIHGPGLQWLGSWVLVFELLWGILSTVHCRNQDLWRERESSFRHGLCLNFSLVFALSQMHTYVCVILVFSVT
jgi:hypothetical protein